MTRAEQHAQWLDRFTKNAERDAMERSGTVAGVARLMERDALRDAAALIREMQAAIEGQSCACKFMSKEPRPESGHYPDCWKAPFL